MKAIFRFLALGLAVLATIILLNAPAPQARVQRHNQTTTAPASPIEVAAATAYEAQVEAGLDYFRQQAQEQLPLVENLLSALQSGDLEAAKAAYVESRPPYEEIEVYAGSFEQEDTDIDARPYAFELGELSPEFKGFHKIERYIYRDQDLASAVSYAQELVGSIQSLSDKLNDPSNFSAAQNFAGMVTLATEVPAKKISSEEETWSDQSLLIFKHNWLGIHSQYQPYASLVSTELATTVEAAYQNCMDTIAPFFTEGQTAAAPYSSVDTAQRRAIIEASYQYRDAIAQVAQELNLSEVSPNTPAVDPAP